MTETGGRRIGRWVLRGGGGAGGTRRGLDRLDRQPAHPVGLAIFAEWTTTPDEWALYQATWVHPARR